MLIAVNFEKYNCMFPPPYQVKLVSKSQVEFDCNLDMMNSLTKA